MKKLLVALLMLPALAQAEFLTGNDLYTKLTSRDVGDRMYALGYVVGVYDVNVHITVCPRSESGITAGQVQDITINYLAANPGQRHRNAEVLVRDALRQIWPCANRNNKGSV